MSTWALDSFIDDSFFTFRLVYTRYHWRSSYSNPPKFIRRFDNLEQFSYKNLQPLISLRFEIPHSNFCQFVTSFDSHLPFWNPSSAFAWLVQAAAALITFTDSRKYFCFPDTDVSWKWNEDSNKVSYFSIHGRFIEKNKKVAIFTNIFFNILFTKNSWDVSLWQCYQIFSAKTDEISGTFWNSNPTPKRSFLIGGWSEAGAFYMKIAPNCQIYG